MLRPLLFVSFACSLLASTQTAFAQDGTLLDALDAAGMRAQTQRARGALGLDSSASISGLWVDLSAQARKSCTLDKTLCAKKALLPASLRVVPAPRNDLPNALNWRLNERHLRTLAGLRQWRWALRAALEGATPGDRLGGVDVVLKMAQEDADPKGMALARKTRTALKAIYPDVEPSTSDLENRRLLPYEVQRKEGMEEAAVLGASIKKDGHAKVIERAKQAYPLTEFDLIAPQKMVSNFKMKQEVISQMLPWLIAYAIEHRHTKVEKALVAHLKDGMETISDRAGSLRRAYAFVEPIVDAYIVAGRARGVRAIMNMFPRDSARYTFSFDPTLPKYRTARAKKALRTLLPEVLKVLGPQQRKLYKGAGSTSAGGLISSSQGPHRGRTSYRGTPRPYTDASSTAVAICAVIKGSCIGKVIRKSPHKDMLIGPLTEYKFYAQAMRLVRRQPKQERARLYQGVLSSWRLDHPHTQRNLKLWKQVEPGILKSSDALYVEALLAMTRRGECGQAVRSLKKRGPSSGKRSYLYSGMVFDCMVQGQAAEAVELMAFTHSPLNTLSSWAYTIEAQGLMSNPKVKRAVETHLVSKASAQE